jgi:hypothetical protein
MSQCRHCDHWQPGDKILNRAGSEIGRIGQCRRNAPVVAVVRGLLANKWPLTPDNDRCGEFTRAKHPAA